MEQKDVILFLHCSGKPLHECKKTLQDVYRDQCMGKSTIQRVYQRAVSGEGVKRKKGSGRRPSYVSRIDTINQLIMGDRRITIRQIALQLDMSSTTVFRVVKNILKYRCRAALCKGVFICLKSYNS